MVAPDSTMSLSTPVSIALSRTSLEAGTTTVLTFTFFPLTTSANRLRSSYLPLVHVPTKTWSKGIPSRSDTGFTLSTLCGTASTGSTSSRSKISSLT